MDTAGIDMPFITTAPASLKSINAAFTHGKSCCITHSQAPITTQYGANRNSTTSTHGLSSKQSSGAIDTKNYDSLNPSAPPPFRSSSKTGAIDLDLSTEKHSLTSLIRSDMLSDNGTYLQDHRAGKPCLSGYPSGEHLNLKSLNQGRADLW